MAIMDLLTLLSFLGMGIIVAWGIYSQFFRLTGEKDNAFYRDMEFIYYALEEDKIVPINDDFQLCRILRNVYLEIHYWFPGQDGGVVIDIKPMRKSQISLKFQPSLGNKYVIQVFGNYAWNEVGCPRTQYLAQKILQEVQKRAWKCV